MKNNSLEKKLEYINKELEKNIYEDKDKNLFIEIFKQIFISFGDIQENKTYNDFIKDKLNELLITMNLNKTIINKCDNLKHIESPPKCKRRKLDKIYK